MKNEKGFTLIEVMIASSLFVMISIGLFKAISHQTSRSSIDELAYTTALVIYEFSKPAHQYIEDNSELGLPERIDKSFLVSEGYMHNDSTVNITPLGHELVVYTNMDYGFPLSTGIFMEGEPLENMIAKYELDSKSNMFVFRQRVSSYLSELLSDTGFRVGVLNNDYELKWSGNAKWFNLEPYIHKSKTRLPSYETNTVFFNFQKNPGYWVLNYDSTVYNQLALPDWGKNNPDHKLYSLGYSDFCPSPGIKPVSDGFRNYFTYSDTNAIDEFSFLSDGIQGAKNYQYYVCLPATKISVENNKYEVGLTNQYYGELGFNSCRDVPSDYRRYMHSNIVELAIGSRKYTFSSMTGMMSIRCYHSWSPMYHAARVNYGGISPYSIDMWIDISPSFNLPTDDVIVNRIKLK